MTIADLPMDEIIALIYRQSGRAHHPARSQEGRWKSDEYHPARTRAHTDAVGTRLRLSCLNYLAVLSSSAASNLVYRAEPLVRALFLIALICIIGQLWQSTFAHYAALLPGFTANSMIWYRGGRRNGGDQATGAAKTQRADCRSCRVDLCGATARLPARDRSLPGL